MRQSWLIPVCTVLAMASVTACGEDDNLLEGSISEQFSLDFDRVRIRKQDFDLIIEYLKDITGGTDKVCKVVVDESVIAGNSKPLLIYENSEQPAKAAPDA